MCGIGAFIIVDESNEPPLAAGGGGALGVAGVPAAVDDGRGVLLAHPDADLAGLLLPAPACRRSVRSDCLMPLEDKTIVEYPQLVSSFMAAMQ